MKEELKMNQAEQVSGGVGGMTLVYGFCPEGCKDENGDDFPASMIGQLCPVCGKHELIRRMVTVRR